MQPIRHMLSSFWDDKVIVTITSKTPFWAEQPKCIEQLSLEPVKRNNVKCLKKYWDKMKPVTSNISLVHGVLRMWTTCWCRVEIHKCGFSHAVLYTEVQGGGWQTTIGWSINSREWLWNNKISVADLRCRPGWWPACSRILAFYTSFKYLVKLEIFSMLNINNIHKDFLYNIISSTNNTLCYFYSTFFGCFMCCFIFNNNINY